jgi:hypothetical protein
VDLHNVRVLQPRYGLRFALEPLPFLPACISAGEGHLQGDYTVEAQVSRPEDNPHAATTQHGLHFVTRYSGQRRILGRKRGRTRVRFERGRE